MLGPAWHIRFGIDLHDGHGPQQRATVRNECLSDAEVEERRRMRVARQAEEFEAAMRAEQKANADWDLKGK